MRREAQGINHIMRSKESESRGYLAWTESKVINVLASC
jgi:hypothetical protein